MIGRSVSTVKSSNSYLSYRQPYLGWRSLERLKLSGQSCLSPEQRLAASLLNQVSQPDVTITITTSAANRLIGEVVQSQRRPLLGPSPG